MISFGVNAFSSTGGEPPLSAAPAGMSAIGDKPYSPHAVAQEFEAFVLQSFIEAMLPRDAEATFGHGTAGAFWRSMLAEQMARELARTGGIGLAQLVSPIAGTGADP